MNGKLTSLLVLLVAIYASSPLIFKYFTSIQKALLFMNNFDFYQPDLTRPEASGLKCVRVLRLRDETSNIELGAWHILPESSQAACSTTTSNIGGSNEELTQNRTTILDDQLAFSDSRPIVLYAHGNKGTRAGEHRVRLYHRLAYELDYHVITFDYRGYADSTYESPTALGLSSDARFMYDWLLRQPGVTRQRVVIWAHSLGTAVAVRMLAELPEELAPRRLVLEAPFDSLASAIANHPFSLPFRLIPYFEHFFVEPIRESTELNFDSVHSIVNIKSTPILILHAEDDAIIPFKLGRNLFEVAAESLGKARVKFLPVGGSHNLGHKDICLHDETMLKVKQFIGAEH